MSRLRSRRGFLSRGLGLTGSLAASWITTALVGDAAHAQASALDPGPDAGVEVIPVVARRFSYTPSEIRIVAGRDAILEFTSLDFVHGFRIPDLDIRASLLPGLKTRVRIPAPRAGRFPFLCDNFCGDGHEEMNGVLIVAATDRQGPPQAAAGFSGGSGHDR